MAEDTPMPDAAPAVVPQKRPAPADDTRGSPAPTREKAATREAREKKDSWRKKEAQGSGSVSGKHTGSNTPGHGSSACANGPGLVRYRLPPPQSLDYYGHRAPPMVPSDIPDVPDDLFSVIDHPMNRRGFRYTPCEASRLFSSLQYRGTEYEPFTARINFEDMNSQVHANRAGTAISTAKGWRMARANVGVREGEWYYECRITRGITGDDVSGGHVRVGWARREAPLDAPVGSDAYSYGLRDQSGQKVHMSRPRDFHATSFVTGDVIGLHISLPSLAVQRDLSSDPVAKSADIIRDRLPIRFKNQLWFEHFEYHPTKEYEDLMNPASNSGGGGSKQPASSAAATPKTLPGSFIKVYKNGEYIGTPWEDLYAFLPPASKPSPAVGGRELDDGSLGYYPAVSVFKGGTVEVNFGPTWQFPPADLGPHVRPVCERYPEQIAEDVLYDLVDEVDLLFTEEGRGGAGAAGAAAGASVAGAGVKEEIKEMVMEDE